MPYQTHDSLITYKFIIVLVGKGPLKTKLGVSLQREGTVEDMLGVDFEGSCLTHYIKKNDKKFLASDMTWLSHVA